MESVRRVPVGSNSAINRRFVLLRGTRYGAKMSKKKDIHVVTNRSGWATRREGADRVSSTHDTQSEAIDSGRARAIKEGVELVIHRPDGRIRDSDSYGNDPIPPRDKKH